AEPGDETRAAGSGGAAEAGGGEAAETAGLSADEAAKLAQIWGGRIRLEVEKTKRPPRVVRRDAVALIALTVGRDGALLSAELQESAGSGRLDDAAIRAVRDAAPYVAAPEELFGESFRFVLPIRFQR
ncbi:MAG: TonB family protein, partial [Pseudomonadota bacterium]